MKFKVGDKVVPHSKSRNGVLISSEAWQNAQKINQPFLYIVNIRDDFYCCDEGDGGGDHFNESDLTLYVTSKPQTIKVTSDNPHLLKAMWEELKKLGYESSNIYSLNVPVEQWNCKTAFISNLANGVENIKDLNLFRTLTSLNQTSSDKSRKSFDLPKQWDECLKFAKEQIEHPFWDKKQIKKIVLGSKALEFEITKAQPLIKTKEGNIDISELKSLYKQIPQHYNSILGHSVSIGIKMINIGCMSFSYSELTQLIDEYDQLNS